MRNGRNATFKAPPATVKTLKGIGVKADAIPGRLVSVKIFADNVGSYFGQCSELCGAMHAFMPIEMSVIAVSQ